VRQGPIIARSGVFLFSYIALCLSLELPLQLAWIRLWSGLVGLGWGSTVNTLSPPSRQTASVLGRLWWF